MWCINLLSGVRYSKLLDMTTKSNLNKAKTKPVKNSVGQEANYHFCKVTISFLNWSKIALQCCISFCCTKHESAVCIHVSLPFGFSLPTISPLEAVTGHWAELPVIHSCFPLAIGFACGSICMTHSSVLAWRIPGTGEPGGLPSLGSHRVGHDRGDLVAAAAAAYVGQCYSPNLSHPLLPLLCPHVYSVRHLLSCPENRFICTIFLDSIYMF